MKWLFEPVPRPVAVARACGLLAVAGGLGVLAAGQWLGLVALFGGAMLLWGAA
jgi:hypothetical protein